MPQARVNPAQSEERDEDLFRKLIVLLDTDNDGERASAVARLRELLRRNGSSFRALLETIESNIPLERYAELQRIYDQTISANTEIAEENDRVRAECAALTRENGALRRRPGMRAFLRGAASSAVLIAIGAGVYQARPLFTDSSIADSSSSRSPAPPAAAPLNQKVSERGRGGLVTDGAVQPAPKSELATASATPAPPKPDLLKEKLQSLIAGHSWAVGNTPYSLQKIEPSVAYWVYLSTYSKTDMVDSEGREVTRYCTDAYVQEARSTSVENIYYKIKDNGWLGTEWHVRYSECPPPKPPTKSAAATVQKAK